MSSDRTFSRRTILKGAAIGGGALLLDRVGLASTLETSVPTTDVPAYVLPSASGVEIAAILTVGDAAEWLPHGGNTRRLRSVGERTNFLVVHES